MPVKRQPSSGTIHKMAFHRGLRIHKARRGGWYVTLGTEPIYCSHAWDNVYKFISRYPILIRRREGSSIV